MHSDQTVSLRPGGGKGRLFGPRSSISSSSSTTNNGFGTSDPLFPPRLIHDGTGVESKAHKSSAERIRYSKEELYKFKEVITIISEELKSAIAEIEAELVVSEEPDWARPSSNAQVPPPVVRYAESDNRDWKSRAPVPEEKGKDQQLKDAGKRSDSDWRDKEQDRDSNLQASSRHSEQYSSRQQEPQSAQYARQYESASGVDRPTPTIIRASDPWTARRSATSEKEKVLRTVKGILNKLTPEKFDVLLEQLLKAGIDSADILKGVISLIFDKAVLEPTFCPMYADMCLRLSKELPEFPSEEDDGRPVTFRRILLNSCQEEFEGADNMRAEIRQMTKVEQELERAEKERLVKIRTLGNIRLIGELFKQTMIPERIVHHCIQMLVGTDTKSPAEENIEALCQLLTTVGKQLDQSAKSVNTVEAYFSQLKDIAKNQRLAPRIRFLIRDTVDLRANKWVPRRQEVRAKTINEIHAEAEQTLGLRPGLSLRNGRGAPNVMGMSGLSNSFQVPRPGSMMPGMPGLVPGSGKMPGSTPLVPNYHPGVDSEGWETFYVNKKNKIPRDGLMPPPNTLPSMLPGRTLGVAGSGPRPSSASSKFLPPGSGGSVLGRSSALLGDSGIKLPSGTVIQGHFGTAARNPIGSPEKVKPAIPPTPAPAPTKLLAPTASSLAVLQKKSESLLKEYLSVGDRNEAALCVEELQSPDFHPQFVQLVVSMAFEGKDTDMDLMRKLLEFLFSKKLLLENDIRTGILPLAEQLDDLALDTPNAPKLLGELIGKLALAGVTGLEFLVEVLQKAEDPQLRRKVFDAALAAINLGPNSEQVLGQRSELQECERLTKS